MLSISSAPHPDSWFNNCFLCSGTPGAGWNGRQGEVGVSSHPLTSIHSHLLTLTP